MMERLNWSFAEECARAVNVERVRELFLREVSALGFAYAACASHVDPLRPPQGAVMIVEYPEAWLKHFSSCNYAARDPVFLTAQKRATPFQWCDPMFRAGLEPDQIQILGEAA